jgi:hypothetical protein
METKSVSRKNTFLFLSVCVIYAAVSALSVNTLLPNCDEAWFTIPGYNLVENGFFGTTVLDETATFRNVRLDGINQYTYWIMPVYPLLQGAWGKIVGFGLIETRTFSLVCGIFALGSWFVLIRNLSKNVNLALLTVLLLALDYHFIYASSFGRMDMLTAALGAGALALFTHFRDKRFDIAILISFTLAALSFFTHPLGLIWAISLAILIVFLDRKRIGFKHLGFAALPFILLGTLWITYILQRPDLFFTQFGGNASNRWAFFQAPFGEFWREIQLRYLYNFGVGEGLSEAGQIKVLILLFYVLAVAAILISKSLRSQSLSRFLIIIALQEFVMLLLLDSMKQHYYLIHIVPTLTVIMAVWINSLWKQKPIFKYCALAIIVSFVLINLSIFTSQLKRNAYRGDYLATANFLNQNMQNNDTVTGSAEFWFSLKQKENLTDDYRLGYRTGKRSKFVILDAQRYKDWIKALAENDPAGHQNIQNTLRNEYDPIFQNDRYEIFELK